MTQDEKYNKSLRSLIEEQDYLDNVISRISDESFRILTPAEGWTVQDTIVHLAYFDGVQKLAIEDREAFKSLFEMFLAATTDPMEVHLERTRREVPSETLIWWRSSYLELRGAFESLIGNELLPWFGPEMRAITAVRSRLMETWAHGVDVLDALKIPLMFSERLYDIAYLGVKTRNWSFLVNGESEPESEVYVELNCPDGSLWQFGEPQETDFIRGSALDFCLLVTQRRNRADLDIRCVGSTSTRWVEIAQAFAGPKGKGRPRLS